MPVNLPESGREVQMDTTSNLSQTANDLGSAVPTTSGAGELLGEMEAKTLKALRAVVAKYAVLDQKVDPAAQSNMAGKITGNKGPTVEPSSKVAAVAKALQGS